jgi:hypothetical protein
VGALVFDRSGARLNADVRARILEMARGNPLALPELLLAAADVTGDRACVLGAAAQLGIGAAEVEAAEAPRLLRVTADRVSSRHLLVRSAVYASAPCPERKCRRDHDAPGPGSLRYRPDCPGLTEQRWKA